MNDDYKTDENLLIKQKKLEKAYDEFIFKLNKIKSDLLKKKDEAGIQSIRSEIDKIKQE